MKEISSIVQDYELGNNKSLYKDLTDILKNRSISKTEVYFFTKVILSDNQSKFAADLMKLYDESIVSNNEVLHENLKGIFLDLKYEFENGINFSSIKQMKFLSNLMCDFLKNRSVVIDGLFNSFRKYDNFKDEIINFAAKNYKKECVLPYYIKFGDKLEVYSWVNKIACKLNKEDKSSVLRSMVLNLHSFDSIFLNSEVNITNSQKLDQCVAVTCIKALIDAKASAKIPNSNGDCAFRLLNYAKLSDDNMEYIAQMMINSGANAEDLIQKKKSVDLANDAIKKLILIKSEQICIDKAIDSKVSIKNNKNKL